MFNKGRAEHYLIYGHIVYDPLTEHDKTDEEIRINNLNFFKGRKEHIWKKRHQDKVMTLKGKGKLAEAEEDYDNAIKYYMELVKDYNSYIQFPYNRLVIIFRKLKRYEEELNVCELAIQNLAYYKHRTGYIGDGKVNFIDDDMYFNHKINKF